MEEKEMAAGKGVGTKDEGWGGEITPPGPLISWGVFVCIMVYMIFYSLEFYDRVAGYYSDIFRRILEKI